MILTEYLNNGTLVKHYSDRNVLLLQNETGDKYAEPIDTMPCAYTYTETDELIEAPEGENTTQPPEPADENEATVEDYQNALRQVGVNV